MNDAEILQPIHAWKIIVVFPELIFIGLADSTFSYSIGGFCSLERNITWDAFYLENWIPNTYRQIHWAVKIGHLLSGFLAYCQEAIVYIRDCKT